MTRQYRNSLSPLSHAQIEALFPVHNIRFTNGDPFPLCDPRNPDFWSLYRGIVVVPNARNMI